MRFLRLKYVSIFLLTLLSFQCAQAASANEASDKIRSVMKQHFPDLAVNDIKLSPINGLYQVSMGPNVLYVTSDARYALSGDIIDLQNEQNNLTEEVRKQARLNGIKDLGQENMIIFSPKSPKYTVTVFTDVDCGYCRKMQSEMSKINELGIAIRYLAFPRSGPDSPTFNKMVSVWCAKDKKNAMTLAQSDKQVTPNLCRDNNVMKELQFGLQIGVSGTPTLIFEDGTMVPGYLPPDKLLEVAEHLAKKSS